MLFRGFIRSRKPLATSQVIPACCFDKLDRFSRFSGEACPPDPRRESRLTAPFLPQPPTSQNQPLITKKLIETPVSITCLKHQTMIYNYNY